MAHLPSCLGHLRRLFLQGPSLQVAQRAAAAWQMACLSPLVGQVASHLAALACSWRFADWPCLYLIYFKLRLCNHCSSWYIFKEFAVQYAFCTSAPLACA